MTVCNMSIEAGARAGMVAPDDTTFDYLKGRPYAPSGRSTGKKPCRDWRGFADRRRRKVRQGRAHRRCESATRTSPGAPTRHRSSPITGGFPIPSDFTDESASARPRSGPSSTWVCRRGPRCGTSRSTPSSSVRAPTRGSRTSGPPPTCSTATRSRRGPCPRRPRVRDRVKEQAESEGLDQVFIAAGFEWREPGCSMCLAMNPDKLSPGERCASTSNRNFEGRQGRGGRTHLVSPAVAAATAVAGHFASPADPSDLGSAGGVEK